MRNSIYVCLFALYTVLLSASIAAQTGGNYKLEQTVVASGGGQNSSGGNFALDGTIGQPAAGTLSTNNPFAAQSGFWTTNALTPTAATVSISGRILTPEGRGLINARVVLTDMHGNTRTVISSSFGYYCFDEVEVGQIYIVTIASKRYRFSPQVLTVMEEIGDLNFIAQLLG